MGCTHKRREHGRSVPVLQGIAEDVKRVVDGLYNVEFASFGVMRKYRGSPKIRVRWGEYECDKHVVRLEVCDPTHGEGIMRLRALHPGALARTLHKALDNHRRLSAYCE